MDRFQFDEALKAIRAFAWDVLADNYIELVKARLYGQDGPEKRAAQDTLYHRSGDSSPAHGSFHPLHLRGDISRPDWRERPLCRAGLSISNGSMDQAGLAIKEVAASLRRYKAEKGMALNSPLPGIVVYSDLALETADLIGVANSPVESKDGKALAGDEAD